MSDVHNVVDRPQRRFAGRVMAGGVIVALAVAGGVAWAAIPSSSSGAISACYVKSGPTAGSLRVINAQAGARCRRTEIPISWNSAGIRYRGAWRPAVVYQQNDVVTRGGSSYLARVRSRGVPTGNAAKWAVLAARGATGPTSAGAFFHLATYSNSGVNAWEDVASFSYTVPAGGNVVARFSAESFCNASSWCSARILVDGVEMTGGSGASAAFDDGDPSSTWEAHAIDRYAPALTAGTHTFTVQMQLLGSSGQTFRLDDANLVLQTIG